MATRKFTQTNARPGPEAAAWARPAVGCARSGARQRWHRAPGTEGPWWARAGQPKFGRREAAALGTRSSLYLYWESSLLAPSLGTLDRPGRLPRLKAYAPGSLGQLEEKEEEGGGGGRCLPAPGSGFVGRRQGGPGLRGKKRRSEGTQVIRWVNCAKVLKSGGGGGGGGGGGQRDLIGSDFSFIHEEGRGPEQKEP